MSATATSGICREIFVFAFAVGGGEHHAAFVDDHREVEDQQVLVGLEGQGERGFVARFGGFGEVGGEHLVGGEDPRDQVEAQETLLLRGRSAPPASR